MLPSSAMRSLWEAGEIESMGLAVDVYASSKGYILWHRVNASSRSRFVRLHMLDVALVACQAQDEMLVEVNLPGHQVSLMTL